MNLVARVRATVRDRIGAELVTSHGDLVTEEIEHAEVEELSVSLAAAGAASDEHERLSRRRPRCLTLRSRISVYAAQGGSMEANCLFAVDVRRSGLSHGSARKRRIDRAGPVPCLGVALKTLGLVIVCAA